MRNAQKKRTAVAMASILFAMCLSGNAQQVEPSRKGIVDVGQIESKAMASKVLEDKRYEALSRAAYERGLRLKPEAAYAKTYPEGYMALFIPAIDKKDIEKGFLVKSGPIWALSIKVGDGEVEIPEGFVATSSKDGSITVAVVNTTKPDTSSSPEKLDKSIPYACQYVKSTGFDFGCFALPDNFLGQYYLTYYRYGTVNQLGFDSWWACYKGSAHSCPRYESPASPYSWISCGPPPDHPEG